MKIENKLRLSPNPTARSFMRRSVDGQPPAGKRTQQQHSPYAGILDCRRGGPRSNAGAPLLLLLLLSEHLLLHDRLRVGLEQWAYIPVCMVPYFQFSWLLVSYMHAGKRGLLGVLQPPQTILFYPNLLYLLHVGT